MRTSDSNQAPTTSANSKDAVLSCVRNSALQNHDDWLKKFNKSKQGQIFNLMYEIQDMVDTKERFGKESYACSLAWIMAKGTRFESDARKIIENICPDFFKD